MGGSSSQPQTTTQSTKVELPDWVNSAAQSNYAQAQQASQNLAGPYQGQRVADMTSGQLANINALQGNVGSTQPAYDYAQLGAASAMNYSPLTVYGAQIGGVPMMSTVQNAGPQSVQGASFGSIPMMSAVQNAGPQSVQGADIASNLPQFMNPYVQNVINPTLSVLDQQRQQALNQIGDNATRAGAFGGSRQGVQEGVTNAQYGMQGAQLAGQLYNQAVPVVLNAAQQQAQLQQQANLANQSLGFQGSLANQQYEQQANQLNQAAALQTGLANQQYNQQANLANQSLGLQAALANQQYGQQANQVNQAAQMQALLANQQAVQQANLANQNAGLQNAQLGLAGAQNLGALATQGQAANIAGIQAAMGGQAQLQAQQQAQLAAAQQLYSEQANMPLQQLQVLQSALSNSPYGNTTTGITVAPGPSSNPWMQGLGLGMMGLSFLSDRTEKTDIKKVGKDTETGLDLYAYRYKGDPKKHIRRSSARWRRTLRRSSPIRFVRSAASSPSTSALVR